MFSNDSSCNKNRREAGFNLVELMVVVTIIGILAGVAVPRFATFKARAMQTEAKSALNGVFLAAQAYQANYNNFPTAVVGAIIDNAGLGTGLGATIGFGLQGNATSTVRKYDYYGVSVAEGWVASATSRVSLANKCFDSWRINANKQLFAAFDAVSQITDPNGITDGAACATALTAPTIKSADCANGGADATCA